MTRFYRERGERQLNERGELSCADCGEWHPAKAFGLATRTLADGAVTTYSRSYCPDCDKARMRIRSARYRDNKKQTARAQA